MSEAIRKVFEEGGLIMRRTDHVHDSRAWTGPKVRHWIPAFAGMSGKILTSVIRHLTSAERSETA